MTEPRWDLTHLYKSKNDPKIMEDLANYTKNCEDFAKKYKGNLETKLGEAVQELDKMSEVVSAFFAYGYLAGSVDANDDEIKTLKSKMSEAYSNASAHMVFFSLEIADIADDVYENLLKTDELVAKYKPYLDDVRKGKPYHLSADVERALTLRAPYGAGEWSDFMREQEALLKIEFEGKELSLSDAMTIMAVEKDADRRFAAYETVAKTFKEKQLHRFMGRAFNAVMGAKMVEDVERGYASPIHSRNLENKVDEASVQALHDAVFTLGAEQNKRFYKLKAELLGMDVMKWSDRSAPLPITDTSKIEWEDCMKMVKEAYASFSPKLAELVTWIEEQNMIDVPTAEGKQGGAYDYTFKTPNGIVSYNFLNYTHTLNDVMTTAHELGHGVHGILANEAQGSLMSDTPLNYAETASIFGEMVTFKYLLSKITDKKAKLALLMDKLSDHMNTVTRQICFSAFEQECHERRKNGKLTLEEFDEIFLRKTKELYGEEGEIFTYEHADIMWCYVSHFLRPFYVYAYSFGELFTQSLFAVSEDFGDKFEPMYLDLLRAGGTKDAVELMKPFGLNPNDPEFWRKGIEVSSKAWLDEAEQLAKELKAEGTL